MTVSRKAIRKPKEHFDHILQISIHCFLNKKNQGTEASEWSGEECAEKPEFRPSSPAASAPGAPFADMSGNVTA